jgi:hypothetical protein
MMVKMKMQLFSKKMYGIVLVVVLGSGWGKPQSPKHLVHYVSGQSARLACI